MMFGTNKGVDVLLPLIPEHSVGAEIGVWKGQSSAKFLTKARYLHLVDPWSVTAYEDSDEFGDYDAYLSRYSVLVGSRDPKQFQAYYNNVYQTVVNHFAGQPVRIWRETSQAFFQHFIGILDWVYLDGSHSFEGCLEDLRSAALITDLIFGDDYGKKPGVTEAVDQFIAESGRTLHVLGDDQYRITK